MKHFLTLFFLFLTSILFAQHNLVSNQSFEDTVKCPDDLSEVSFSTGWSQSGDGTSDYFNSCAANTPGGFASVPRNLLGYQYASQGNAYCGIMTYVWNSYNYREYIGRQFPKPLIIGQNYYVSFKINLANIDSSTLQSCNCSTDKLGVLFTINPFYHNTCSPTSLNNFAHVYSDSIVSDTLKWTTISGSFIADSAYNFINIGNFFVDSLTNKIVLKGTNCVSYYFIDEICVSTDSLNCYSPVLIYENNSISEDVNVFPNPAANELTINYSLNDNGYIEFYDIFGVKRQFVSLDNELNSKTINLSELKDGIYFYSICNEKGSAIKKGKLIIKK